MDKYLVDHITKYFVDEVWLLIYDSESNCDHLHGVYRTKKAAIKAGINHTKEMIHNESYIGTMFPHKNEGCGCERVCEISNFETRSMNWGPATEVGHCMYVVQREVED